MPIKMFIVSKIAKYSVLRDGENRRNFQKCLLCFREVLSLSLTAGEICKDYSRVYIFFKKNLSYGFPEAVLLVLCEVTNFFLFFVFGEVCLTLVFHVLFQNNFLSWILLCLYTLQKKEKR